MSCKARWHDFLTVQYRVRLVSQLIELKHADQRMRIVSFFERRRQFLLVRINHEHSQQLSRFGLARVRTDAVAITRHLGEALSFAISNNRLLIDRTLDRSVENGCIDCQRLSLSPRRERRR